MNSSTATLTNALTPAPAPAIVGIDVGYGNTKCVWSDPGAPGFGPAGEVCFPSVVPPCYLPALERDTLGSMDRTVVEIEGQSYFVGRQATMGDDIRMLDPEFIHRPEYRVLVAGALHYYMKATGRVGAAIDVLALGLPVSAFHERRAALKALGSRVHRVPVPRELRERAGRDSVDMFAKRVVVVPQPFGGLRMALSGALDVEGDQVYLEEGLTLVIDPGFSTFDWMVADKLDPQFELCGSFAGGVAQILRTVSHAAGLGLGIGDLNLVTTERALASGVLNFGGKRIDFKPFQAVARMAAQRVVDEFLLSFNFQKIGIARVVLVGGGAKHYFVALRERLPGYDIALADDAVMGNARGYWKIGHDVLQREQSPAAA